MRVTEREYKSSRPLHYSTPLYCACDSEHHTYPCICLFGYMSYSLLYVSIAAMAFHGGLVWPSYVIVQSRSCVIKWYSRCMYHTAIKQHLAPHNSWQTADINLWAWLFMACGRVFACNKNLSSIQHTSNTHSSRPLSNCWMNLRTFSSVYPSRNIKRNYRKHTHSHTNILNIDTVNWTWYTVGEKKVPSKEEKETASEKKRVDWKPAFAQTKWVHLKHKTILWSFIGIYGLLLLFHFRILRSNFPFFLSFVRKALRKHREKIIQTNTVPHTHTRGRSCIMWDRKKHKVQCDKEGEKKNTFNYNFMIKSQ